MDVAVERAGVRAIVRPSGCMTTLEVQVDGRWVSPLYVAPWKESEADGLLTHLRGDFLCVPFGVAPDSMDGYPDAWRDLDPGVTTWGHGFSSNGRWTLEDSGEGSADFVLTYPPGDAIEWVRRRVQCIDGGVEITDSILAATTAIMPLGLHPMLRLPEATAAGRLVLPDCDFAVTRPVGADESAVLVADARIKDLRAAPLADGGTIDLTLVPLPVDTEEVVLLCNVHQALVAFENREEGYRVTLEWDPTLLQHLQLWFSNRGRSLAPWNGRNLCLGVEPVTAPFDLGASIAAQANPLSAAGAATAVTLEPGEVYEMHHRIAVTAL